MDVIDSEYAMKVEYGDFGEADEEIQKRSGKRNYNIKLTLSFIGDRGLKEQEERAKEGVTEEVEYVVISHLYQSQELHELLAHHGVQ